MTTDDSLDQAKFHTDMSLKLANIIEVIPKCQEVRVALDWAAVCAYAMAVECLSLGSDGSVASFG